MKSWHFRGQSGPFRCVGSIAADSENPDGSGKKSSLRLDFLEMPDAGFEPGTCCL
jgi:hypothetical protein